MSRKRMNGGHVSGVRVAMRLGAAVTTIGFFVGVVAAPAVSADTPRGENAWWYTAMKIADAQKETTGKGVAIGLVDGPVDPKVPELRGQDVVPVVNVCGGEPTGTGNLADHGTAIAVVIDGSGEGNPPADGVKAMAPHGALLVYSSSTTPPSCTEGTQQRAFPAAIDKAVADNV